MGRVLTDENGPPVGTCFQVASGVLVTARHVLVGIEADRRGASVWVDPLAGGTSFQATVKDVDEQHDLAVLASQTSLPAAVGSLKATKSVKQFERVAVTGHALVKDAKHHTAQLTAIGHWAGTVTRDDVLQGRMKSADVMRGMSGAPVTLANTDIVIGVVSGRYNSSDGWLPGSVWVARTEDLKALLDGIPDSPAVPWVPLAGKERGQVGLSLDDLIHRDVSDPRVGAIAEFLSQLTWQETDVASALSTAGMQYEYYQTKTARWLAVVTDAAERGQLDALIDAVAETRHDNDLRRRIGQRLESLDQQWYSCENPWKSGFVGPAADRAIIDRKGLRAGLRDLATGRRRVLIVSGPRGSGKSHSWQLIDHLQVAGELVGREFRWVRPEKLHYEVTEKALAEALAEPLGVNLMLPPGGEPTQARELPEARVRTLLNAIVTGYKERVAAYQQQDRPCWIVLDGLDRDSVLAPARELARELINLVNSNQLPFVRLVVTGLEPAQDFDWYEDDDGNYEDDDGNKVPVERIPAIGDLLVRAFLVDVAAHLGYQVDPGELNEQVAEVLGHPDAPRTLREIERATVRLVKARWAGAPT